MLLPPSLLLGGHAMKYIISRDCLDRTARTEGAM